MSWLFSRALRVTHFWGAGEPERLFDMDRYPIWLPYTVLQEALTVYLRESLNRESAA